MKRSFLAFFLLFFLFNNHGSLQAQEKVYLPFFEVLNLPDNYKKSATRLYSTYLLQYSDIELQTAQAVDSNYLSETSSVARESAEAWGIPNYMAGEINKMGETILVSLSLYSTSDGSLIWNQSAKASSEDDVHILLERFAMRTSLTGLKELPKHYNTKTEFESSRPKTKKVITSFGLTMASMVPVIEDGDSKLHGGLGMLFSFDAGNLIFDINLESMYQGSSRFYYSAIDVLYPFSKKSNTFFVKSGLGFGKLINYRNKSVEANNVPYYVYFDPYLNNNFEFGSGYGTVGFLGGGYIINRDKRTQLRLGIKGFYTAFDIFENQSHQPFGGIFTASLLFH